MNFFRLTILFYIFTLDPLFFQYQFFYEPN
jgi:hypothetical protein